MLKYLKGGHVMIATMGPVRDVITGELAGVPHIMTDGVYAWPGDLIHYLRKHHVSLPNDFVEHASRNNWQVPGDVDVSEIRWEKTASAQ